MRIVIVIIVVVVVIRVIKSRRIRWMGKVPGIDGEIILE
jgi:hypothetical protein